MKQCEKCGRDILDNAVICPYCGSAQEEKLSMKPTAPVGEQASEEPQRRTEEPKIVQQRQQSPRFCMNCGNPLTPDSKFCPACGHEINMSGTVRAAGTVRAPGTVRAAGTGKTPGSGNAAGASVNMDNLKEHLENADKLLREKVWNDNGNSFEHPRTEAEKLLMVTKSSAFLILLAIFTLSLSLEVISNLGLNLIWEVCPILLCIGAWMIFAAARKNTLHKTGFALIHGTYIAEFVLWIIGTAVFTIFMLLVMAVGSGVSEFGYGGDGAGAVKAVLFVFLLIGLAFFGFWLAFSFFLMKLSASAKKVANGEAAVIQVSRFLIAAFGINLGLQALSLIFSFFYNRFIDYMYQNIIWELDYDMQGIAAKILDNFRISIFGTILGVAIAGLEFWIMLKLYKRSENIQ